MSVEVQARFEAYPEPSPNAVPIGPDQLARMDDNLHWGWSWHRYRYVYRRAEGLRILDAGCGTGLSSLALARLNPGSKVLGVDFSPRALELARERLQVAPEENRDVTFQAHDLRDRLPADLGPFDFIVCRGVLGLAEDSAAILANLAAALDDRGLLLAEFPAPAGRQAARQLRRAVEALCPPEATLDERVTVGRELFEALRSDHPVRRYESLIAGPGRSLAEHLIVESVGPWGRDWSLAEAIQAIEAAGLRFLYAAAGQPWQPGRIFHPNVPEALKSRVEGLSDRDRAVLMDALDPSLHLAEYRLYACPADFEPRQPGWPDERTADPEVLDRLIPHPTGLVRPLDSAPGPVTNAGPRPYQAVTGVVAHVAPRNDIRLQASDGQRTCGEIDQLIHDQTGQTEPIEQRHSQWLELANRGFLLLESPDRRQHVDCVHLGPVRDRLDCPCPRRWIRSCEWHGYCTIDAVNPDDERRPAFDRARDRLGIEDVTVCARCSDYTPDEQ